MEVEDDRMFCVLCDRRVRSAKKEVMLLRKIS